LAVWSILGLIYYWYIFKHDEQERFGKSFSLCTVLLFLNFFSTALWLRQATITKIPLAQMGGYAPVHEVLNQNSSIQLVLIMLILLFMADIFTTMRRREHAMSKIVIAEQQASRTRRAYLSNMTHDIGLTMNAIMSYVKLARKSGEDYQDNTAGCPHNALDGLQQGLIHTDSISHYFLHLVKEMEKVDRIQSNTLKLYPVPTDIRYNLKQVKDIFTTQMQDKNIDFMVYTAQLENPYVYCDKDRLQRILLNLISLAYEFTPAGGSIAVTLAQKGFAYHTERADSQRHFQLYADYELRIKDSGNGMPTEMSNDFINSCDWETLFKKVGPERSLAITKHLIELFQGSVNILTEQGTEVIINLTLPLAKQSAVPVQLEQEAANMI
jgi:signal transduction histidine kinase